jgi:hypothetical protein
MGSSSGKMGAYGKPKFKKKFQKLFEKNFFLEHVSGYFSSSICGKSFGPIGPTVFDI